MTSFKTSFITLLLLPNIFLAVFSLPNNQYSRSLALRDIVYRHLTPKARESSGDNLLAPRDDDDDTGCIMDPNTPLMQCLGIYASIPPLYPTDPPPPPNNNQDELITDQATWYCGLYQQLADCWSFGKFCLEWRPMQVEADKFCALASVGGGLAAGGGAPTAPAPASSSGNISAGVSATLSVAPGSPTSSSSSSPSQSPGGPESSNPNPIPTNPTSSSSSPSSEEEAQSFELKEAAVAKMEDENSNGNEEDEKPQLDQLAGPVGGSVPKETLDELVLEASAVVSSIWHDDSGTSIPHPPEPTAFPFISTIFEPYYTSVPRPTPTSPGQGIASPPDVNNPQELGTVRGGVWREGVGALRDPGREAPTDPAGGGDGNEGSATRGEASQTAGQSSGSSSVVGIALELKSMIPVVLVARVGMTLVGV